MTRSTLGPVDRIETAPPEDLDSSERAPLLAGTPTPVAAKPAVAVASPVPSESHNVTVDVSSIDEENDATNTHPLAHLRALLRPRVLLLCFVVIFLLELAVGTVAAPTNAIMESIICRQMHPDVFLTPSPVDPTNPNATIPIQLPDGDGGVVTIVARGVLRHFAGGLVLADDPVCKGADVQGYLVMLRGWQNMLDCVPGIIGTVPFGVLSDRWGRRPVMGLSLLGIVASVVWMYGVYYFSDVVPLWVSLFSSAFQLIGGGGQVLVAMLYTTIADVVAAENRATVFFHLTAVFLGSQMIAGPLGGYMLRWGPWFPLLFALAMLVISQLVILAFPETVHVHDKEIPAHQDDSDTEGMPPMVKLLHKAKTGLAEVWDFVLGNKNLAFLMLSLTFVVLGRFVGEILLQYATDRYHWSWEKASMVLSIRSAGSLVALLVVLPAASLLCVQRLGLTSVAKDLWIARWSGVVSIIGSWLIAAAAHGGLFSFGLIWLALGTGMTAVIRSLLNTLVEEHHVGTVNSLVGFMETVGMTLAGPLLAKSLDVGLHLGGGWMGLPFHVAGLLFVIATVILWAFRMPERQLSVEPAC